MGATIDGEIRSLRKQPISVLKERYCELFGEPCVTANREHLVRRIGWRLQALAEGGLTERARRRAAALVCDADLRLRPPRSFYRKLDGSEEAGRPARDFRLPAVGTVLTREYQACLIEVRILEDGYEYAGKQYRSLSAIAFQVTGTRWNGFTFFKLKPKAEDR